MKDKCSKLFLATPCIPWYLYKMVVQSTLRLCEDYQVIFEENLAMMSINALNRSNCHICGALYSDLPAYIRIGVYFQRLR